MRRIVAVTAGIWLIGALGCYVPVGSDNREQSASQRQASNRLTEESRDQPAGPSTRLVIQGDTIRAEDMRRELREELTTQRKTLQPQAYRAYVEQRAVQWINDKIADALLYHRASLRLTPEMNTRIDSYVDTEIRKIVTRDFDGVQRRYEKHLEEQGRTLEEERAGLRRTVIVTSYLEQEIKPKVAEPTRAELLAAYESNRDSWRTPARRRMSLIDVRVLDRLPQGVTTPTREQLAAARAEARSTIQAARDELRHGASFDEVARRYSDGLHAEDGGAWGWVSRGGVRPRFAPAVEALYELDTGQVSDVIETEDALLLVRCDEIDPGTEPQFTEVQPDLADQHYRETYNRMVVELMMELRQQANVDLAELERFHAVVVDVTLKEPVS
ncbi:MAG: peptidylprolyl isomerase [Planctomycetes bacterium]|nr:peptidylprolyl isomerase [Planctomycetota bacterium]